LLEKEREELNWRTVGLIEQFPKERNISQGGEGGRQGMREGGRKQMVPVPQLMSVRRENLGEDIGSKFILKRRFRGDEALGKEKLLLQYHVEQHRIGVYEREGRMTMMMLTTTTTTSRNKEKKVPVSSERKRVIIEYSFSK